MSGIPPEPTTNTPAEEQARVKPSPSRRKLPASGFRSAAILSIVSLIVLAVSTYEVMRGNLGTVTAEISAAVALAAFGFLIYALLQLILAMIESAGDRRRQAREATERRHRERS